MPPKFDRQILATMVFAVNGVFVNGATGQLDFVDGLGADPVDNLFVDLSGVTIPPIVMGGTLTFLNQVLFIRSDCDGSGVTNLADPLLLLGILFSGVVDPACPKACDFNDSGDLNLADSILVLQLLFQSGSFPPPPFPNPGVDPTPDNLSCQ